MSALQGEPLPQAEYDDAVAQMATRLPHLPAPGPQLLVALDVDGTVMDMSGNISQRVLDAVARMQDAGAHVVVSTGRGIEASMPVAEQLGLHHGWMVCANGALTLRLDPELDNGYEIVESITFDPAHAIDLLLEAVPNGILGVAEPGVGFKVTEYFPEGELIENEIIVSVDELRSSPVNRVVMRVPGMDLDEFSKAVEASGLHSVEYAIGWTAWLDLAPEGVTKATALDGLCHKLGIAVSDTLALGDGTNDVEMLEWAGVGIAMGSAPDSVVACADLKTEPVWRDGCSIVLDALTLKAQV